MSDMRNDPVGADDAETARRIEEAGIADESAAYVVASKEDTDADDDITSVTDQSNDVGESEAHPS
ncbi:hypothetical protein [Sphingomonas sp. RS2018]